MTAPPLLAVDEAGVVFDGPHGRVEALRGVSLRLHPAEVLAVVGESGSGKSTLARVLMGMVPASSGRLALDGEALALDARARPLRQRRQIGMVFQDSAAAFDPRFSVERILREPLALLAHDDAPSPRSLLDSVGLPASLLERRPHELSGGQRQRVGIARALAGRPRVLICDEAVSALDVSVQAQILNLLVDLQAAHGLAILFITHDLAVVSYIADRVAVMRGGEIVESGELAQVIDRPAHDYTRHLLAAGL